MKGTSGKAKAFYPEDMGNGKSALVFEVPDEKGGVEKRPMTATPDGPPVVVKNEQIEPWAKRMEGMLADFMDAGGAEEDGQLFVRAASNIDDEGNITPSSPEEFKKKIKTSGVPFGGGKSTRNNIGDMTRVDGTKKANGFFGEIANPNGGVSTELSVGFNIDGKEVLMPSLVPTLTSSEIDKVLAKDFTPEINKKIVDHASGRIKQGRSPFWEEGDKVMDTPTSAKKPQSLEDTYVKPWKAGDPISEGEIGYINGMRPDSPASSQGMDSPASSQGMDSPASFQGMASWALKPKPVWNDSKTDTELYDQLNGASIPQGVKDYASNAATTLKNGMADAADSVSENVNFPMAKKIGDVVSDGSWSAAKYIKGMGDTLDKKGLSGLLDKEVDAVDKGLLSFGEAMVDGANFVGSKFAGEVSVAGENVGDIFSSIWGGTEGRSKREAAKLAEKSRAIAKVNKKGDVTVNASDAVPKNVPEIVALGEQIASNKVNNAADKAAAGAPQKPTEQGSPKPTPNEVQAQNTEIRTKYKGNLQTFKAQADMFLTGEWSSEQFRNATETGDVRYSQFDLDKLAKDNRLGEVQYSNAVRSGQKIEIELANLKSGTRTKAERDKEYQRIQKNYDKKVVDTILASAQAKGGKPEFINQAKGRSRLAYDRWAATNDISWEQKTDAGYIARLGNALVRFNNQTGDVRSDSLTPFMNTSDNKLVDGRSAFDDTAEFIINLASRGIPDTRVFAMVEQEMETHREGGSEPTEADRLDIYGIVEARLNAEMAAEAAAEAAKL
jgi:hypothetical protein